MPQTEAAQSVNPAMFIVIGVGVFVLVALAIAQGNRIQRRFLWCAVVVAAAMVLCPPWVGQQGKWVMRAGEGGEQQSSYEQTTVSIGYSFVWSPPKSGYGNVSDPIWINKGRLLIQLGVLGMITLVPVYRHRRRPLPDSPVVHGSDRAKRNP